MLNSRQQAGDTIIEVMLSLAIVGMVIGVSFATASRALRTGRFAQEQSQAVQLAQGQLEKVKYVAGDPTKPAYAALFSAPGTFCLDDTLARLGSCTNVSNLYTVQVTYGGAPSDTFTARVTWAREETGAAPGEVSIAYRVHKQ